MRSRAEMAWVPGTSGHMSGDSEDVDPMLRPLICHSIVSGLAETTRSGSVWNSRRNVGSMKYTAPDGGLEI